MKHNLGDHVTTNVSQEAFYSNYGGQPECFFEPGDVGIVAKLDVPVVRKTYKYDTYTCVDFWKYGRQWRVNLYKDQMAPIYGPVQER